MAMKKSKGKGVSAPEPTASSGQMKMAQRSVKNPATLKNVATGGKGTTAPKPAVTSGQMKMAQRPIKVLGKIGSGKGKK
jgi:hypothetical protein